MINYSVRDRRAGDLDREWERERWKWGVVRDTKNMRKQRHSEAVRSNTRQMSFFTSYLLNLLFKNKRLLTNKNNLCFIVSIVVWCIMKLLNFNQNCNCSGSRPFLNVMFSHWFRAGVPNLGHWCPPRGLWDGHWNIPSMSHQWAIELGLYHTAEHILLYGNQPKWVKE